MRFSQEKRPHNTWRCLWQLPTPAKEARNGLRRRLPPSWLLHGRCSFAKSPPQRLHDAAINKGPFLIRCRSLLLQEPESFHVVTARWVLDPEWCPKRALILRLVHWISLISNFSLFLASWLLKNGEDSRFTYRASCQNFGSLVIYLEIMLILNN